jgi:hypothetical protein
MNLQTIIGRALVALIAPLAMYLASRYGQAELGGILSLGIGAIGGELLLRQAPPVGKGVPTQLIPLLLLAIPLLGGCAFLQKPATQNVVRCTGAVVSGCGEGALGTIAACLAAPANPTPCLLALLSTGSCATREALACRVRDAAQPPVIMGFTSIDDGPQRHREAQAEAFLKDVGITPVAP